jgi:hypothetical protein
MARAPKPNDRPQTSPAAFEPDAGYRVKLRKPIFVAGQIIRPGGDVVLRGRTAELNRDAIETAEKV